MKLLTGINNVMLLFVCYSANGFEKAVTYSSFELSHIVYKLQKSVDRSKFSKLHSELDQTGKFVKIPSLGEPWCIPCKCHVKDISSSKCYTKRSMHDIHQGPKAYSRGSGGIFPQKILSFASH